MDLPDALLLIDIQMDYFPGGRMELAGAEAAAANAGRLLAAFREAGRPVAHVRHVSTRPEATFFLPGTPGIAFHPLVEPAPGEIVVEKSHPNCFRSTDLLDVLQKGRMKTLLIAGMMTHMCVDAAVRAATDLGFGCTVVGDACATRDLAFGGLTVPAAQVQAAFLAALNGTYARVADTAGLLDAV